MQHNLLSPSFHFGERPSLRANKMESALRTEFSQVGTMARPAGVGGVMDVSASISTYGEMLAKGADRGAHALQTASPYAERAEPGWAPMEPTVKPSWSDKGAGTVSAGCIDNTYIRDSST